MTPQGTEVAGPDGSRVLIPAGALQADVTVRIARDSTGMPALPAGVTAIGDVFVVTPHGQSFEQPVQVRLPPPSRATAANEELKVAKISPGGTWQFLDPQVSQEALIVTVADFSWFVPVVVPYQGPLAETRPLALSLGSMTCNGGACNNIAEESATVALVANSNRGSVPATCVDPKLVVSAPGIVPIDPLELPFLAAESSYRFTFRVRSQSQTHPLTGRWPESRGITDVSLLCGGSAPSLTHLLSAPYRFGVTRSLGIAEPEFAVSINGPTCNGGSCAGVSGPQLVQLQARLPGPVSLPYQCRNPVRLELVPAGSTSPIAMTATLPPLGEFPPMVWGSGWMDFVGSNRLPSFTVQPPVPVGPATFDVVLTSQDRRSGEWCPQQVKVATVTIRFQTAETLVPPSFSAQPRSASVVVGETVSFTAVATGLPEPTLQWQRRADPSQPWSDVTGANAGTHTTGPLTIADSASQYRVVASNVVGSVTSTPVTVTVSGAAVAPSISVQPTPLTVVEGSEAVFAVVARGTEALSYQWYRDGTQIAAANGAMLKLTPATLADGASYHVVVSNIAGSVTSASVRLTVLERAPPASPPSIVTQPASITVTAGNSATFAVGVSGGGPITYQWLFEGSEIPGATAAAYTLLSAASGNAGRYSVRVSNSAGSITSTAATLTVTSTTPTVVAPTITTHPATLVAAPGTAATLAVAVSGTSPFTYQWLRNGTAVPGATGAVLTLTNISSLEAGSYVVTVSNGAGSVTSNAADVIVLGVPVITGQPSAQTVSDGASATFAVVATGDALRYQWQRNGQGIPGAESASYTTPALSLADSGAAYSVIVYNQAGLVVSTPAAVTVTGVAPTINTPPASVSVNAGQTATFSVVAAGSAPLGYQWRKNGADITGATSASYTTPATITADSGALFTVVVSNAYGSVTSTAATLTVTAPPLTGAWGSSQLLEGAPELATEVSTAISRETGDGVVVWTQSPDGVVRGVYANIYDADTDTWSGRTLLVATASGMEGTYYPKAAINSTGDVVVAWMQNFNQSTGNLGTIRARRYKPNVGWGDVYTLTRIPGGPEPTITWTNDVDVDMDFAGNATVVWSEDYQNLGISLMATARMPAGGSFQTAELLESAQTSADAEWTRVVMDSAGGAIATWQRKRPNGAGYQIVARRRPANGTWGNEVILDDVSSSARLQNPDIAVNPTTGDALVAWRRRAATSGSVYDLRYSRYLAATDQWTSSAPGETDTATNVGWISVAVNKIGQGVIAWERSGTTTDVRAARVDVGNGALGSEIAVADGADLPSVGIDINGNVMAMFIQSDGFRPRAQARRLFANGTNDITVVLSSPSIYADFGTVAVADDGRAIAGWMEGNRLNGLYTSGSIYAKVFR